MLRRRAGAASRAAALRHAALPGLQFVVIRHSSSKIQQHTTKIKRSVERAKTHIGTSSQGPGAVPASARLGVFWRAQGRVPWQTRMIYATTTVVVGGATWIVIDPPAVRLAPRLCCRCAVGCWVD